MSDASHQQELERIIGRAAETGMRWSRQRSLLLLDEKSAGQFASNADIEIEEQIRWDLADAFPGDSIVGEETGGSLGDEVTGWAIDPIDGTSNFILGLPIWGVSIGYLEHGRSTLGAIVLPELKLMISALRGHGMRVNGSAHIQSQRIPNVKVIALGENDYESGPETDARAQVLRNSGFAVVRYRCAVFSLGVAALGRLSGYIENGCGLWDIAAADVICNEAGMRVETYKITEGRYHINSQW
ncbi:MAG: inositol monophosphatase [Alphaproteobacteria bacterium]|nr:inositol monophosphatase [Alphaproteobacteria bacterium]MBU2084721.1 inositol monophosphatase [Alphaproteobacteria bacterium]MBU2144207.1 inositol monophosphatase [Alphaproteobacteria bacterium]MBU2198316.1 inositol monophosphatase [Alphaproteobacteria bacterium]